MHIQISLGTKCCLKLTLKFLDQIIQKGYFGTKKNENNHQILRIQINLIKFTKLINISASTNDFEFWNKFLNKSKREKNEHHY